ncbi:unnamed protein product, partial [marine sediment metagenome]
MLKADANGLPINATNTDAQVSGAVTASHARQHALNSAADHTGSITDAQHGVRTKANAHAHGHLSGIGANDHHAQVHTIVSHDTTGTGAELDTLTDGSDASALHNHTTANLNDTTAVGADLNYAKDLRATGVTAAEYNRICDGILATAAEVNTTSDGATAKNNHVHPATAIIG